MPLKHFLMATICLTWCAEACPARDSDYLYTYKQIINGKETIFTNVCFMDNKQWIAAKTEELASLLAKSPEIDGAKLLDHQVTAEELEYLATLPLSDVQLGAYPEGVILKAADLTKLKSMKSLVDLDLCVQDFDNEHVAVLSELPSLEALTVSTGCEHNTRKDCKLSIESVRALRKLKHLEWFRFNSNSGFDDEMLAELIKLDSLTTLYISGDGPRTTDRSIQSIIQAKKQFKHLSFSNTSFSQSAIRELLRSGLVKELEIEGKAYPQETCSGASKP